MKQECAFCKEEAEKELKVPSDVITDRMGNIKDVILNDKLPVCNEYFYNFYYNQQPKKVYKWIERLLQTPYVDGRKRIVDLVLMPYLANIKEVEKKRAVKRVNDWLDRCSYDISNTYLESQFKYVKNKGLKPLTKENFKGRGLDKYRKKVVQSA